MDDTTKVLLTIIVSLLIICGTIMVCNLDTGATDRYKQCIAKRTSLECGGTKFP